jgi:two-component system sensor histidine kinase KdpD
MDNIISPDPDKLLQQIKTHVEQTNKGYLKVFLGAAAGVGKTYAILKAATQLLSHGEDVVIGYIETHGRVDVESIVPQNIEYIPLKLIEHKGTVLKEFNVDEAIKRKPKIIIVDELAHTNAINSRNNKRYQDILELINAGISVLTAVNIQHIESLNSIVEQITNIPIIETVPDKIIEIADEVVLIDLPPEELIDRLKKGKVYSAERVEHALSNFFRKGNLTVLRELSLRKTAQKVDKQVLQFRNRESIEELWPSNDKLILILEPGSTTEKIIRQAKQVIDKSHTQWYVSYVESPAFRNATMKEKRALLNLLKLAENLGAIPLYIAGTDAASAIAMCVKENNINTIMLGQYKPSFWRRLLSNNLGDKLSELIPGINLILVSEEINLEQRSFPQPKPKIQYLKFLSKVGYFAIIFTILGYICYYLRAYLASDNILMIYLLVMIIANSGRGKVSAVVAAIIGTLSFDFFITPPFFSFTIAYTQDIISCLLLAIVGVTFSVINGNLRFLVSKFKFLHLNNELYFEYCLALAETNSYDEVSKVVLKFFRNLFNSKFMLLLPNVNDQLEQMNDIKLNLYDPTIAVWVYTNNRSAGLNTDTFSANSLYYAPIYFNKRTRGVIVIQPFNFIDFFIPQAQRQLSNFIKQMGATLDRVNKAQLDLKLNNKIPV